MKQPVYYDCLTSYKDIEKQCESISIDIDSPYRYNGQIVPRVTSILSDMLHEDYLMDWANNVGLYQHKRYTYYRDLATDIGSIVHEAIETYMRTGEEIQIDNIAEQYKKQVYKCWDAFMSWWELISHTQHKVILQEYTMITPYCGGTLDLLMTINGSTYLIDFKTSSSISFKYYLQLAAYRRMLKETLDITADNMMIVRLDKKKGVYEQSILNLYNNDHYNFIKYCDSCFMNILFGYYNRYLVENMIMDLDI